MTLSALVLTSDPSASAAGKEVPIAAQASQPSTVILRNQAELDHVADLLSAASDGGSGSGLAGIQVDPGANKLTIYWHGSMRQTTADILSHARTSGIQIDVRSGKYTAKSLRAEAARLGRKYLNKKLAYGDQLSYFKPKVDGSGLEVGVMTPPNHTLDTELPPLRQALDTKVALDYVVAGQVRPSYRYSDAAPYWGGSYMHAAGGVACTSGFGVADDQTGQTAILTAAHCGVRQWLTGGDNRVIGDTGTRVPQYDAELVMTSAGNSIYDGTYMLDESGQYQRVVANWSSSYVGDYICASGAYSGGICNIRVAATGIVLTIDGVTVLGLVQAEQQNHLAIEGDGDSGGPMFSLTGTGDKAIARGTITAHDSNTAVPCRGIVMTGRECAWRSYYPDISNQLQALHVHVITG